MKTKLITLLLLATIQFQVKAQEKPKALILNFQTEGLFATPSLAANIVRIELDKLKQFAIYEQSDISDITKKQNIVLDDCYSATCVLATGKATEMNKVFSGSMLMLGNKIVITLKMYDVATEKIEKTQVEEFVNIESELQNMVQITVMEMFEQTPDKLLTETLLYFQNMNELPTTKINNNGPRMGLAYMGGRMGKRYHADESQGGYGSSHVISQMGYQLEAQYLSAGNLQALAEFMFIVGGLDQQMFIPSLVVMNGFRLNDSGWELAFGPSFGLTKVAIGYYENNDENQPWHLATEYSPTVYNESTASYEQNPFTPTLMGNIDKRGFYKLTSSWVWGFGKTFRSGYLNIPVNAYFSKNKNGWFTGISCGFNIRKKEQKVKVVGL